MNPDGDRSLFQGPWYALAGTVPNVTGAAGTWATMNGAGGYGAPFKNHPLKDATHCRSRPRARARTFRRRSRSSARTRAAAATMRDSRTQVGCIIQSWPHFTPGYFHFVKSAAHVGGAMTNAPPIPDVINAQQHGADRRDAGVAGRSGQLREGDDRAGRPVPEVPVNATDDAGIGKTY